MALPLKKRPYRGSSYVNAKRLRTIERQVFLNRSEKKSQRFTFNADGTTGGAALADDTVNFIRLAGIGQGTASDDRIGDQIRIYRITIRGYANSKFDLILYRLHGNTLPSLADFSSQTGSCLGNARSLQYTEIGRFKPKQYDSSHPVYMSKYFKYGNVVKYLDNTSTGMMDNEIILAVVNRSGQNLNANLTAYVEYTDA